MKPCLTRLALGLSPLLLTIGCDGGGAADSVATRGSANAPAAAPSPREAALAAREQAQFEWLGKTLETASHAGVYSAALQQARGRAAHCPDAACRERALDRRQARLDFADGKAINTDRLAFSSGRFAREERGYDGPVRIVPLVDGKAMLVVSLTFKGRPACALDGVMTRDDHDETWTVTSLEQGLPTLVLTPEGKGAFDLSYAEAGHQPYDTDYCGVGTGIDGRYVIAG